MQHNPKSYTKSKTLIEQAAYSSTQTGTGVTVDGFRFAKVIVTVGAVASGATMDVTLEESDSSGSGYAAITGAAFTQITNSNTGVNRVGEIFLQQRKKYLRAVATYGGSGTAVVGVELELSGPKTGSKCDDSYDFQLG